MVMAVRTASETGAEDYAVSKLLSTPLGVEKYASEQLPQYIKIERDYKWFLREILIAHPITADDVHTIDNEDYIYYSKDMNAEAVWMGMDDEVHRSPVEATGVNVPIITLGTHEMTIHKRRLMTQKYAYLERVKELAGQAVMKLEDLRALFLFEKLLLGNGTVVAPQYNSQIVTTADTNLKKEHLVNLKKVFSGNHVEMAIILCNPATLDDMLAWNNDAIDQLTMREIWEGGAKYQLWGSIVIKTSMLIPDNYLYALSTPEKNGRVPELLPLTIELTETKNRLEKGLFMYEFIGFYLNSHKTIGKLILRHEVGSPVIDLSYGDEIKQMAKKDDYETGYGSREESKA
jgi:hypothetical protein